MRLIICVLLIVYPSICFAEQYLCIADYSIGFAYNESSEKWEPSKFNIEDSKYIISPSKYEKASYEVKKMGEQKTLIWCEREK